MQCVECGAVIVSPKAERCVPCRNRKIAAGRRVVIDETYFLTRSVLTENGCLEWQGARLPLAADGSGNYGVCGKVGGYGEKLAHRLVYRALIGPIPEGREVSHLCDNPPCVEVAHLTIEPHRDNMHRAAHIIAQMATTHCPRGHAYSGDNLYVYRGHRYCRACARIRAAERYARTKRTGGEPA